MTRSLTDNDGHDVSGAAADAVVRLRADDAQADFRLLGAEAVSWRVRGRELLWHGDPAHWAQSAPILFPVVGASSGGKISVDGVSYPMSSHGFARRTTFKVVERTEASAKFRLSDLPETRVHYPFPFQLDVVATLTGSELHLDFEVTNTGTDIMPYALGYHPAFPWPFDAERQEEYRVEFDAEESPLVPLIAPDGLLMRETRSIAMNGRALPVSPDMFASGALVFLNARSRALRLASPSGSAVELSASGFRHLALWTKPTAPFLSLEAWTGHAEWAGEPGDLAERPSKDRLGPGASARYSVALRWIEG